MKAIDLIIPKNKVEYIYNDITVGDALRKISKKRFTMVPVLERNSERYLYSLAASDILMRILKDGDIEKTKLEMLSSVSIDRLIVPCDKETDITALADLAVSQNFIPIIDAKGAFVGLVTRQAIIDYLISEAFDSEEE